MAQRPVFIPADEPTGWVTVHPVDFTWFPGLARSQKRKSVASLHAACASRLGTGEILEISSSSEDPLGVALSAFNLTLPAAPGLDGPSVECAFQAGKVFARGGPFADLLGMPPTEAKRDPRLAQSGPLVRFEHRGRVWPLDPRTAFYDWLYLSALRHRGDLLARLQSFAAFTDIAFNPKRSVNCQAGAAALAVALARAARLDAAMASPEAFLAVVSGRGAASPPGQRGFDF